MKPLTIALTKGRLEKKTVELFERAGMDCTDVKSPGRRLIVPLDGGKYQVVLAKAPDVITYVERGVVDIGVVGRDTILEQGQSFYEVLDLGFGACRFMLAVPNGVDFFNTYKRRRVATKYPNVAAQYFAERGMDVELIKIEGSVELSPLLGLADGIVDLVETGETLRANGLREIEEIAKISARVIVNTASMRTRKAEIKALLENIKL
ncbi:MAG: ATP phosphoribosyltransferase [Oscillospiraceae bacterium]|nr:ATP phosphoribosyltransferase [Oscillospiraceae bacterium]